MGSQNLHPQILSTVSEMEVSFSHLCEAMEPCPGTWWRWFCCPERYQVKAGQWFSHVGRGLGGRVLTSFRIRVFVLSTLLLLTGFPVRLCLHVIPSVLTVAGRALRALMKDSVHLVLQFPNWMTAGCWAKVFFAQSKRKTFILFLAFCNTS